MTTLAEYQSQVGGLHAQADAYARLFGYTLGSDHNTVWDAFRHAYVSAEMTRAHGSFTAKLLGDLYEAKGQIGGQAWQEKNMDLWNNAAGRKIGENSAGPSDTARRVKNAFENGSLITDPKDARKHSSTPPEPNDKDPEVCCEDCGAADMFPPPPPPPYPNESVYLEDGQELTIPPMTMPPFVTAMARMALTVSDEQTEQPVSSETSTEPSPLPTSHVDVAPWAELMQASVDSAMALIIETRTDVAQYQGVMVAAVEVALDPILATLTDHRDVDTAVI